MFWITLHTKTGVKSFPASEMQDVAENIFDEILGEHRQEDEDGDLYWPNGFHLLLEDRSSQAVRLDPQGVLIREWVGDEVKA